MAETLSFKTFPKKYELLHLIALNSTLIFCLRRRVADLKPLISHLHLGIPEKKVELAITIPVVLKTLESNQSDLVIRMAKLTFKIEYNSASGLSVFLSNSPF